jgi:hypothetical protein
VDWIWGQAQHLGNRAFDPLDLRRRLTVQAGCGAQIWGQTQCPIYGQERSRGSTLQRSMGAKGRQAGYGDRHEMRPDSSVDLSKRRSDGWGDQLDRRCSIYRSGTLNVQRSTLNF